MKRIEVIISTWTCSQELLCDSTDTSYDACALIAIYIKEHTQHGQHLENMEGKCTDTIIQ